MRKTVFVTGLTGVLGSYLLQFLQNELPEEFEIIALCRPESDKSSFRGLPVTIVSGDLTSLASTDADLISVLQRAHYVIHMAADVRWNTTYETANEINTTGTKRLLALVETFGVSLRKFIHVSTAFVRSPESDMPKPIFFNGAFFNNNYEFSKSEAEQIVIASNLRTVIIRPSLITGDSEGGRIYGFNGIYHVFRMVCKRILPIMVGTRQALVDVVPIDFVCRTIANFLVERGEDAQIVDVISGESCPTIAEIFRIGESELTQFRLENGTDPVVPPKLINYESYQRFYKPFIESEGSVHQNNFLQLMEAFIPYVNLRKPFPPDENIVRVTFPCTENYLRTMVRFWCAQNKDFALARPFKWRATTPV